MATTRIMKALDGFLTGKYSVRACTTLLGQAIGDVIAGDRVPELVLTEEQLTPCLSQFKGNWAIQLSEKLPTINLQLSDYLLRYINKGIDRINYVSSDDSIELPCGGGREHRSLKAREGRMLLSAALYVTRYSHPNYPAAIFGNCMIYIANSSDALIALHEKTRECFELGLADGATQSQYRYATRLSFPPIFLIVTDLNSALLNDDVLAKLPVPILHTIYAPQTFFTKNSLEHDVFWRQLATKMIIPCFEMLADSAGLIKKAVLTLNSIPVMTDARVDANPQHAQLEESNKMTFGTF